MSVQRKALELFLPLFLIFEAKGVVLFSLSSFPLVLDFGVPSLSIYQEGIRGGWAFTAYVLAHTSRIKVYLSLICARS